MKPCTKYFLAKGPENHNVVYEMIDSHFYHFHLTIPLSQSFLCNKISGDEIFKYHQYDEKWQIFAISKEQHKVLRGLLKLKIKIEILSYATLLPPKTHFKNTKIQYYFTETGIVYRAVGMYFNATSSFDIDLDLLSQINFTSLLIKNNLHSTPPIFLFQDRKHYRINARQYKRLYQIRNLAKKIKLLEKHVSE